MNGVAIASGISGFVLGVLVPLPLSWSRAKRREFELVRALEDAQVNLHAQDRRIAEIRRTLEDCESELRDAREERDALRDRHESRLIPVLGDLTLQDRYREHLERQAERLLASAREERFDELGRSGRAELLSRLVQRSVALFAAEDISGVGRAAGGASAGGGGSDTNTEGQTQR